MMAMKHEIKILPQYFEAVKSGDKTFEIRRDDRGYQKGDTVKLKEITVDPFGRFTGRSIEATITYVTSYEQKPGYVVFAIRITEKEKDGE